MFVQQPCFKAFEKETHNSSKEYKIRYLAKNQLKKRKS